MTRQPILVNDVTQDERYVSANPEVRSELAVPLIAKNRLIGVLDIESEQEGFFRPEHQHTLTLTASRIAQAIENARLYARVSRQAQTLEVLNEISVELASILELDPLLERVGQLLRRLIDYQMFSILLLDEKGDTLITRYAWRFGYAARAHAAHPHQQRHCGRGGARMAAHQRARRKQRPALPAHEPGNMLRAGGAAVLQGAHSSACSTWNTRGPTSSTKRTSAC